MNVDVSRGLFTKSTDSSCFLIRVSCTGAHLSQKIRERDRQVTDKSKMGLRLVHIEKLQIWHKVNKKSFSTETFWDNCEHGDVAFVFIYRSKTRRHRWWTFPGAVRDGGVPVPCKDGKAETCQMTKPFAICCEENERNTWSYRYESATTYRRLASIRRVWPIICWDWTRIFHVHLVFKHQQNWPWTGKKCARAELQSFVKKAKKMSAGSKNFSAPNKLQGYSDLRSPKVF